VVLSGGEASRLGGINKSLIKIGGQTIIDRTVSILKPLFSEVILAGWPQGVKCPSGTITVADRFTGEGPLAGIEAAMMGSSKPYIFVFGGDMPFLSEIMIVKQAESFMEDPAEVFVARSGEMIEPLHSIYSCKTHTVLEEYLATRARHAARDFFRLVQVSYFDFPRTENSDRAFTNINTPEDLTW
jgi:molybdopterin-guanine dinucleotide biosynthesis protein A